MITGIDIGGSHITAALVEEAPVRVVPGSIVRQRVNAHGTAGEILDAWAAAIQALWQAHGLDATKIGIAMPGPFDYEQGIALMIGTDKYEALYRMDVRAPLAARLNIPAEHIRFRNDAEAFLLGEMMSGAGKGYAHAIGITLGTGLGSAVFQQGRVWDADRWKLPMHGVRSEDCISTRFFVNRYGQLSGKAIKGARELAALVPDDAVAAQVFKEFGDNLIAFLQDFIRDEQPQLAIIGGNIAEAWELIYPMLESGLGEALHTTAIRKAAHSETAALTGGACSWIPQSNLSNT